MKNTVICCASLSLQPEGYSLGLDSVCLHCSWTFNLCCKNTFSPGCWRQECFCLEKIGSNGKLLCLTIRDVGAFVIDIHLWNISSFTSYRCCCCCWKCYVIIYQTALWEVQDCLWPIWILTIPANYAQIFSWASLPLSSYLVNNFSKELG